MKIPDNEYLKSIFASRAWEVNIYLIYPLLVHAGGEYGRSTLFVTFDLLISSYVLVQLQSENTFIREKY